MKDLIQGGYIDGSDGFEALKDRPDARVVRCCLSEDRSVILKLWVRPGSRGELRRLTRTSSVHREWRTLNCLYQAGVSVPEPLGLCRVKQQGVNFTDALFIEDIGACIQAIDHVKTLVRENQLDELRCFEDQVIDLTDRMLRLGVVDPDHGFLNTVVPSSNLPVRLDFEIAQRVVFPSMFTGLLGSMLGRLVGTYIFAVQPDTSRVKGFASRLVEKVKPTGRVLDRTKTYLIQLMDKQEKEIGLRTELSLPW